MKVTVQDESGGGSREVPCPPGMTVCQLLAGLKLPVGALLHSEAGQEIGPDAVLEKAGVMDGDHLIRRATRPDAARGLDLVRRLRSAKVHVRDGLEKNLATGNPQAWVELFKSVHYGEGGRAVVTAEEFEFLAPLAIRGAKDAEERGTLFYAMANRKIRSAFAEMQRALTDPDPEVRKRAGWGIIDYGEEGALAVLPLLRDDDEDVRDEASTILINAGTPTVNAAIADWLSEPDPEIRRWTIEVLRTIDAFDQAERVLPFLGDEETEVSDEAGFFLGDPRVRSAAPGVIAFLADPRPEVRAAAAEVLGDMGAVEALQKLLDDEDEGARADAARALGLLRAERALPRLRELLDDDSSIVILEAAEALCRLGSQDGVPAMLEAAEDDEDTSLECLNALRQPVLWRRLQERFLGRDLTGTREFLSEALADEAGVAIDPAPSRDSDASSKPLFNFGGTRSLWAALRGWLDNPDLEIILERDRIRFIPREDALEFWREWAESQG